MKRTRKFTEKKKGSEVICVCVSSQFNLGLFFLIIGHDFRFEKIIEHGILESLFALLEIPAQLVLVYITNSQDIIKLELAGK